MLLLLLLLLPPLLAPVPVVVAAVPIAPSAIQTSSSETPQPSYAARHDHAPARPCGQPYRCRVRQLLSLALGYLPQAVLDRDRAQLWTVLACRRLTAASQLIALQCAQEAVRPAAMAMAASLEETALHPAVWRLISSRDEAVAVAAPVVVLVRAGCDSTPGRPPSLSLSQTELTVLLLIRAAQRVVAVHGPQIGAQVGSVRRRPPTLQLARAVTMPTGPQVRALARLASWRVVRDVLDIHAVAAGLAYRNPVTGPLFQYVFPADSNRIDVVCTVVVLVWFLGFMSGANPIQVLTFQLSSQGITIKRVLGDIAAAFYLLYVLAPYLLALTRRILRTD